MLNLNYSVQRTLTEGHVKDILTTAIEGGIGYWACLVGDDNWSTASKEWKDAHNGEVPCYCDTAYHLFEKGQGVLFEDEQDGDKPYTLTLEKLLDGCAKYEAYKGKSIIQMFDEADFDACDADCIIQYALLGDIIYG